MRKELLAICCVIGAVSGCGSQLRGTWTADKSIEPASPIAAVSFCEDGTYTAHAKYNEHTRGSTGHYSYDAGRLSLDTDGTKRDYEVTLKGDEMRIVHEGKTYTMRRFK